MKFKQSAFLKPYTEWNTKLPKKQEKKATKSKNKMPHYETMLKNGKKIQWKRFDIKIVDDRKNYSKWSYRPTFRTEKQLPNGLILIQKDKCRIELNKPT